MGGQKIKSEAEERRHGVSTLDRSRNKIRVLATQLSHPGTHDSLSNVFNSTAQSHSIAKTICRYLRHPTSRFTLYQLLQNSRSIHMLSEIW
jgi:hypothetical protein